MARREREGWGERETEREREREREREGGRGRISSKTHGYRLASIEGPMGVVAVTVFAQWEFRIFLARRTMCKGHFVCDGDHPPPRQRTPSRIGARHSRGTDRRRRRRTAAAIPDKSTGIADRIAPGTSDPPELARNRVAIR